MLQSLEHLEFVLNHLLISLDVLLEDDLDGHLAVGAICLADDSICSSTEGSTESVLGSIVAVVSTVAPAHNGERVSEGSAHFFS